MKLVNTTEAVGHILCHDLTQIIPGVSKDARFRKGHTVTDEDIPVLLSMGKEHLYVWELTEGVLHEDDAARKLLALCKNENMSSTEPKEGKIELIADCDGLFKVDTERLCAVNSQDEVMIATRHGNTAVHRGDKLAGMRVIPLVIEEEKLKAAEEAAGETPLLRLVPFTKRTAAIVTTGSEVAKGIIKDAFTPVVVKKLEAYGISVIHHAIVGDEPEKVVAEILRAKESGAEIIICTGGMSVDPDDSTPGAIRASGARVVRYGAPVLPGAMLLIGYYDDGTPVLGLPGCVMYAKATIFDLILPRIAADDPITREEIASLGHGGLCLGCESCHFPICPFGK
ncbi:MAG: molybdopterin-binding protein [Clostridia bacterium]|nr:molybdopterin-binding protein [Clostridia bacterium]